MSAVLTFVPLVAIAVAGAILGYLHSAREDAQRRITDLRLVERALEAHYTAADALVDDPATTPGMIKAVEIMNRAMSDKEFIDYFFSNNGAKPQPGPADPTGNAALAFAQAEKLRATRPDLADAFHVAVANALTVIYLRWPGRSEAYRQFVAGAFSQPKEEVAVAGKVVDLGIRKSRRDDAGIMPGAALA